MSSSDYDRQSQKGRANMHVYRSSHLVSSNQRRQATAASGQTGPVSSSCDSSARPIHETDSTSSSCSFRSEISPVKTTWDRAPGTHSHLGRWATLQGAGSRAVRGARAQGSRAP